MARLSALGLPALMALGGLFAAPAGAEGVVALASIDVRPDANGVEIVGRAVGLAGGQVDGVMVISRKGQAGSVSTSQGAALTLKPGETHEIARVGISFAPGDMLEVTVTLKQHDAVIARSSLDVPGSGI